MPQITRAMTEVPGEFVTLLDVCLDLHMGNNGSGDPWSFDRERNVHILQTAITHWEEGPENAKAFDDAVKNLIVVTLEEDKRYQRTPQDNQQ